MGSMTLEQAYFVGELIAAIAVVISLIYVGFQVKQNTIATQTSSAQAYTTDVNEIVGLINNSTHLADVLHSGANGLSELEDGDIIRFMAFHDMLFITYQSFYLQWKKGTLDEELFNTYRGAQMSLLKQKGQREWWEFRRHWFNPGFQNYVEEIMNLDSVKPMHPRSIA